MEVPMIIAIMNKVLVKMFIFDFYFMTSLVIFITNFPFLYSILIKNGFFFHFLQKPKKT